MKPDVTANERGERPMSLEPVHVGELVSETLDLVAPLAAARSLRIVFPPTADFNIHVKTDRQWLKRILFALLSNAVKDSGEGGEISLTCGQRGSTSARIQVTESGLGIAADDLSRVFASVDGLGAGGTDVKGHGLGLALTKRLVEAMSGEIGVESELGQSRRFWVTLPVATAPACRPTPADSLPAAAPPIRGPERTVLYIEDNPSNIKLVETILAEVPEITLRVAQEGRLGLELARKHQPSLVLLDLSLPDMSGEDVLRQIRSDPRTAELAVVVLSADATPSQVQRLRRAGADDYLPKPFRFERFVAVINNWSVARGAEPPDLSLPAREPDVLDPVTTAALHKLAAQPNAGSAVIQEIVTGFLSDMRDRLVAIETAVREADVGEIERQAHLLAGSSGAVGAAQLLDRCRQLEAQAREGNLGGMRDITLELNRVSAETRTALEYAFDLVDENT